VVSRAARSQLEARKLELYDAIRTLDRDRGEGTIDVESYSRARSRFELEAAAILERLDHLIDPSPVLVRRNSQRRLAIIATAGVILLAVALFLGGALRARTGNAAITGDIGQATPAPVVAAVAASPDREEPGSIPSARPECGATARDGVHRCKG